MKRFGIVVALVVALIAAGAVGAGDAAKKELKRLQGTWKVLSLQKWGEPAPAEVVKKMRLIFSGDKVTFKSGEGDEVATVKVDPSKSPAAIDFHPSKPKKANLGIYKLEGDKLTLCLALGGEQRRPKEFTAAEESGNALIILERVKK